MRADEQTQEYQVSAAAYDAQVYGVIGERPAIVYMTSSTSVPVVTGGVAAVQVTASQGPIAAGDLLTTSDVRGVAMQAGTSTFAVFAIALEPLTTGSGVIMAEINVAKAQALQRDRQAALTAASQAEAGVQSSTVRKLLAGVLVVGALAFLLYSFRTILKASVLAIGRNPRARSSLIMVAVGSMVLALVIALMIGLIAIGVLVLPVA